MIQARHAKDYSSHRFLIVDDKQFLRNLIQNMLLRCHADDIRQARDGAAAIKALTEACGDVDCVLCDWNMEPVNGLELLRSIRIGSVEHAPPDLCFIMLTGYGDETVVKTAMELDINGYVVKPVSLDKLIKAIDAAFAKTVVLKPKETYQAKGTVELPGTLQDSEKRVPSWALLSKMRKEAKEVSFRHLEQIRREREEALDGWINFERTIVNEEYLPIDLVTSGKVLAEDIYAERGRLLLARGVVLNKILLGRLRELAAVSHESVHLMVGDFRN